MFKRTSVALAALALPFLLTACGESEPPRLRAADMPRFDDQRLSEGRSNWMQTCRACHLLGVAGAPAVTNAVEWERRISKGRNSLYRSALNGIKGKDGEYRMPPHGGNPRFSEDDVKKAVDYKLAAIDVLTRTRVTPE